MGDEHGMEAVRAVEGGRQGDRLDTGAERLRGDVAGCAVDGVLDARRGLGVDESVIIGGGDDLHRQTETILQVGAERLQPGDVIGGAVERHRADAQHLEILAPVGMGCGRRHSEKRQTDCRAQYPPHPCPLLLPERCGLSCPIGRRAERRGMRPIFTRRMQARLRPAAKRKIGRQWRGPRWSRPQICEKT